MHDITSTLPVDVAPSARFTQNGRPMSIAGGRQEWFGYYWLWFDIRTSRNHVINVIYGASDESGEDLMNLYICIRRSRIIRLIIGRVGVALIYYVFHMCGRTRWSCVGD